MVEVKHLLVCSCNGCGAEKYASVGATVQECMRQADALGWSIDLRSGRAWCERCARDRRERLALIEYAEREASKTPILD